GVVAWPLVLLWAPLRHRGDADRGGRRRLPLRRSLVYRAELAARGDGLSAAHAGAVRRRARALRRALAVPVVHLSRPRDRGGGGGPAGGAAGCGGVGPPHKAPASRLRCV